MVNHIPKDLEEALSIINKEETIILSGGTDLMVRRKRPAGLIPSFDKSTVFISHLKELKKIYIDEKFLYIGAACTFSEIRESKLVPNYFKEVIADIASPAIRNIATIGGNICNASPAADILPLLYALESELVVKSVEEERIIPIKDFITGPGKHIMKKNEILKEIKISLVDFNKYSYKKVGTRKATAIAKLSFIALAKLNNRIIDDIRISFGAVAATIVKSKDVENKLIGKSIKDVDLIKDEIINEYSKLINPIDDQRSNKRYRKQVSINLLKDFLDSI
ncbi:xanthine dehydrogenase family protein subunit M [Clostridium sp. DJ247]|uniref:FAD binding domain-containing protein n=1 Tax=Clostridium sp. DJ247 TaxID=2726188 RepID=UPI00162952EE|nr:FAD binding domain-containing protein [Clostridium sp. DJ247]MBC2580381.1 xanthine dehydrogenase family protein subunit M [Clostridium sp. DJ247]